MRWNAATFLLFFTMSSSSFAKWTGLVLSVLFAVVVTVYANDESPAYMRKLFDDLMSRKKLFDETPPEEIKYWFEYAGPLQVRVSLQSATERMKTVGTADIIPAALCAAARKKDFCCNLCCCIA